MTRETIESFCKENDINLLFMDGYDDCIVGIIQRYGLSGCVCYDTRKIIKKLMDDGMTEAEAEEFFNFNQLGGFHGERTPCFLTQ